MQSSFTPTCPPACRRAARRRTRSPNGCSTVRNKRGRRAATRRRGGSTAPTASRRSVPCALMTPSSSRASAHLCLSTRRGARQTASRRSQCRWRSALETTWHERSMPSASTAGSTATIYPLRHSGGSSTMACATTTAQRPRPRRRGRGCTTSRRARRRSGWSGPRGTATLCAGSSARNAMPMHHAPCTCIGPLHMPKHRSFAHA